MKPVNVSRLIKVSMPLPANPMQADLNALGLQFCQLMADATGRFVRIQLAIDYVTTCALQGRSEVRVQFEEKVQ